ncbi:DNA polymerase III subunit alpha [Sphingosinicella sp.]|uniref:DNA polymerase III subunit alpha n=1 Tax=Sphingosinicella sp. TaxID=1917971 RepID=UPI001830F54C|nr:DNA polymerase III subunit alpha [Sphingosinicella sp.]MBA4757174.1 DNA polymerase III subunit alpha [Sphingosinicella sp.]
MPESRFVHLRIQSPYSMLEGAVHAKDIAKACVKYGMPAAAVTDRNNLFAAMEFSEKLAEAGVQPIIGALLAVARPGAPQTGSKPVQDWLALLAQDEAGYRNLIRIVSRAHLESDPVDGPHVPLAELEGLTDGLIALSAGPDGALTRLLAEGQADAAGAYADMLQSLFPDRLYIELSRTHNPIEDSAEQALIALAHARNLPLVATNPVAFPDKSFAAAHDVLLCIADSAYVETEGRRRVSEECWLKPPGDMIRLFEDVPEAIDNTLVIARRCAVMAPTRKPILPSLAGDREGEATMLIEQSRAGLVRRLEGRSDTEPYFERLDYELGIINKMGFAGYFLIVADFIQWAKSQGIPVGPGRGSGAGSVVAWALTITDLDPMRLGLLFERFLNPERVSMPDFDIDFCETRRGEVIRYVQERYGRDQVAQIITFGTLKARAVLKDVGRVLQMPYGQVDRLAKLVPNHPTDPWTLDRTLNGVAEFVAETKRDPAVENLVNLAMKLEGLPRHASTHAAGVVIGDRPLDELVPLYRDPRSDMPVTQFDMKWVEKAGLVKFDFLGLKTLSVLQRALDLLAKRGVTVDLSTIPWDDPDVFALLAKGDTVGVFQLESEGMRRTLAQVKPDCFEDIIALVSLYRPGPMDNIPSFANRKHGTEAVDCLHPKLEPILKETYGVIIYQEQVMQIAQVLAGYSLGEADLLRRAMGKKKKEEMDAQKARFLEGATAQGVDKAQADYIFELVAKFAGYGFNKSHAAAYALVAYQTGWMKAKYPVEFYAASMAYDIALTDKLSVFIDDMKRMGVECLPPCINNSEADFSVEDGKVRYALAGLKGVGERAMEGIVEVRKSGGAFKSLTDFAERIDPTLLNKRQIESLVSGGAFDCVEPNRSRAYAMAEAVLAAANAAADARETHQGALFGGAGGGASITLMAPGSVSAWSLGETMAKERDAFGFYFAAHPLSAWQHVLDTHGARSYARVCEDGAPWDGGRGSATMAGLVESVRWRTPQNGRSSRYLLASLSDSGGQYVASCFDEEVMPALEVAAATQEIVLINAELLWREGEETPRVTIRGLTPVAELSKHSRGRLNLKVSGDFDAAALRRLADAQPTGRGDIFAEIAVSGGFASIRLARGLLLDSEMRHSAERISGVTAAELVAVN